MRELGSFNNCTSERVLDVLKSKVQSASDSSSQELGISSATNGFNLSTWVQNGRVRLVRCTITFTGPITLTTRKGPLNLRRHLS